MGSRAEWDPMEFDRTPGIDARRLSVHTTRCTLTGDQCQGPMSHPLKCPYHSRDGWGTIRAVLAPCACDSGCNTPLISKGPQFHWSSGRAVQHRSGSPQGI
jgi:hypothetical protein